MAQGRGRIVLRRTLVGVVLTLTAVGVWAGVNRTALRVKYAARGLTTATTDADRAARADALVGHGDAGIQVLIGCVRAGDAAVRSAALAALDRHLNDLPETDPRAAAVCGQLLDAAAGCDDAGRESLLAMLPTLLKRGGTAHAAACRELVAAGLKMPAVESRLTAVRTAMQPQLHLRAAVVPLLDAAEPEVRRAALFAVGPATDDEPVIGDEELFRWLHDPDPGVRTGCHDALVSRGRTDTEISLGRRLAHPAAGNRLGLLFDLRHDDEATDPEPWLERLSRDPDPGVRAGAARVAVELATDRRLPVPVWVGRLADADPEPSVRRVAHHYRSRPADMVDTDIRTAAGP